MQLANYARQYEDKKSDKVGQASQVKDYLGFLINTNTMRVQLIEDRKEAIKRNVEQTLANKARPIHVKELAKRIALESDNEAAKGRLIRGRQLLWMVYRYNATDASRAL